MDPLLHSYSLSFLKDRHLLLAFIRGLVRDADQAEDILQEVWIRLADAVERKLDIQDLASWCRGVARNLVLHLWRQQRRNRVTMDSELLELVEQAYVEQTGATEHWLAKSEALRHCVERLPPTQKRILTLKYSQGLSVERIAGQLLKSASSIMKMLSRTRSMLAVCAEKTLKQQGSTREGLI